MCMCACVCFFMCGWVGAERLRIAVSGLGEGWCQHCNTEDGGALPEAGEGAREHTSNPVQDFRRQIRFIARRTCGRS